jgi:hypothetical protein
LGAAGTVDADDGGGAFVVAVASPELPDALRGELLEHPAAPSATATNATMGTQRVDSTGAP